MENTQNNMGEDEILQNLDFEAESCCANGGKTADVNNSPCCSNADASGGESKTEASCCAKGAPAGQEEQVANESATSMQSDLEKAEEQLQQAEESIARLRAEIYNINQEYSNYVRRTKTEIEQAKIKGQKSVFTALIAVLDDIYAASNAGELQGPFAAIANKLTNTLSTNFSLVCYGEAGDIFDPMLHEAIMAQVATGISEPVVAQVIQPGYKVDGEVLRAAKVIVDNPA